MGKVEELVDTSAGTVRADVVHERLELMGFAGDELRLTDATTGKGVMPLI